MVSLFFWDHLFSAFHNVAFSPVLDLSFFTLLGSFISKDLKILEYLTLPWQVLKVREVVMVITTLLEKSTKNFFPIFNFKIGFSNHFPCSLSNCFICSHTRPFKTWPLLLSSDVLVTSFPYIPFHNYVPAVWNHLWRPPNHSPVCFLKLFSSSGTLSIGVFPWIFSSQSF